jgi:hypothetical protein
MYFVSTYENRRMKPVEIVLRSGERGSKEVVNLRYIASTYIKITMYSPIQLLYTNKIIFYKKKIIFYS